HQEADGRAGGAERGGEVEAALAAEREVEDGDVRPELPGLRQRVRPVGRLGDDLEVGLAGDQRGDEAADDVVVVDEEDPHRHRGRPPSSTSRTLPRSETCSSGLGRNTTSASSPPRSTITSALYPDM